MTGRINLLVASIFTILAAGSIALSALGAHGFLGYYLWPANAVIWCWLWYWADRTNRRLTGGAS